MFAPHLWWQHTHGWPTAEFVRNAQEFKITEQSILSFLGELVLMMSPITLPLWLTGLWWLLRGRAAAADRVIAICALVVVLVFIVQRSKPYYATAAMPMLLAAGAVALERATRDRRGWRYAAAGLLVAGALPIVPMGLPLLRVEHYMAYVRRSGAKPTNQERQELGALPQHFADMHGWEELARTISSVYQALPAEERASARVWAQNYGEAGALEYFAASRYPLPRVSHRTTTIGIWGPGDEGGTLIVIGGRRETWRRPSSRWTRRRVPMPLLHALRERSSHTHRTSLESAVDRRVEQGEGVRSSLNRGTSSPDLLHARSRGLDAPRRSRGSLAAARSRCLLVR